MAEAGTPKPTRTRRAVPGVAEKLKALQANRERLDAEEAERRAQEDAALRRHATASAQIEQIEQRRDVKVRELQAAIAAAAAEAERQAGTAEGEQAVALGELSALGRSAEEIAVLVDLPTKRVRRILRDLRAAAGPAGVPSTAGTRSSGVASPAAGTVGKN